jgi:hypothetical protein
VVLEALAAELVVPAPLVLGAAVLLADEDEDEDEVEPQPARASAQTVAASVMR